MDKKKILVIDDDPAVFYSIKMCLYDYNVIWGGSGLHGINKFKNENPELLLLDIKMADISGPDVLRVIRKSAPDLPVIIITAFPGDVNDFDQYESKIASYIVKPFDAKDILDTVKTILTKED